MKSLTSRSLVITLIVATLFVLPSAQVRSQLAPPPSDPATALQTLQSANAELLKRQDATLKELEDATTVAREARIFARRS